MNRRISIKFAVVTIILFICFLPKVFAQTSSTTELINAEILSNIWYSTTTINENDSINIYAGFQNHSSKNLSGTAGFFIDDLQISKVNFVANSKSLIKLENKYTPTRGQHVVQVKILNVAEVVGSELSVENLLAKESEKNNLSVKYTITKEEVIIKTNAIINDVIKAIDSQAEDLASYVESLKQTTGVSSGSENSTDVLKKTTGKVLGMSTENTDNGQNSPVNKGYFFNILLDVSAYIVRHWIWTVVIILAILLYLMFR